MKLLAVVTVLLFPVLCVDAQDAFVCKAGLEQLAAWEARAARGKVAFRGPGFTGDYDLKYHRLEWEIDPAVRFISGRVTSYFTAGKDGFRQINFELSDSLQVEAVLYRGKELTTFSHGDLRLAIDLPEVLALGQIDSITIVYSGIPPNSGLGSFVQGLHGEVPVIWTLSEPYGARDWWPCKQDLNDKIDSIDVIVRTPSMYRAASNGILAGEYPGDFSSVYHWKHRYPIPAYLIAVAVTNYATYSDYVPFEAGEPLEVLNYVYPEDLERFRQETPKVIPVMQLFDRLLGPYPFAREKYGHAQFGFGGGMEHQTMSFMYHFSHLLVAHELAHQWFGDKVTCGSWQDIWLNEGFATYLEGLTYHFGLTPKTFSSWLKETRAWATSRQGGAVWVSDTTDVNRIFDYRLSYAKGALLLHMLRWKMGDENFFRALRNYLDDPALAYGYAHSDDLQHHLEAASGLDLDEFFADWLYGEGYPSYAVLWSQGGGRLNLRMEQSTSHPSVDFFEMPVPLKLFSAGSDSILLLDHRFSGQEFSVEISAAIDSIQFDPELWILSAGNTVTRTTGSARVAENEAIRLFPNPAAEVLYLRLDPQTSSSLPDRIRLFNAEGRLLREFPFRTEISVRDLPAGSYFLQFTSGGDQRTIPFQRGGR